MTQGPNSQSLNRRNFLAASSTFGAGLGLTAGAVHGADHPHQKTATHDGIAMNAEAFGIVPNSSLDQTSALQIAINTSAKAGVCLRLGPGSFLVSQLRLPPYARIVGAGSSTRLVGLSRKPMCIAHASAQIELQNLTIDSLDMAENLIHFTNCPGLRFQNVSFLAARKNNIHLFACGGVINECTIANAGEAALHALQSTGLLVSHNTITDCANNGIQIWRDQKGEDASRVLNNSIARIRAKSGGTGQNGNGINIFRAGDVIVSGNTIVDCDYSAIRANSASNIQIVSNQCKRSGEVAIYAEFIFDGALIANNLVNGAATGISVTNFNEGGRLAIVQGNLIRNLFRREYEPVDQRGVGIAVEADTNVVGNTIEGAPTCGIRLGWGAYLRDIIVTGNLVRESRYGMLVTASSRAGACFVTNNMISRSGSGNIRAADFNRVLEPELEDTQGSGANGKTIKDNIIT